MNRRGFFRFLASAPAAAVVAPAAAKEVIDFSLLRPSGPDIGFVTRQAGKSQAYAYLYGARRFGGSYTGRWECPEWVPAPMQQAMTRMYRKPKVVKTLELDFAEIERKVMQYYKDDADFTLKGLPGRKFRAIMDEVYEVEDEPEHIEGLA